MELWGGQVGLEKTIQKNSCNFSDVHFRLLFFHILNPEFRCHQGYSCRVCVRTFNRNRLAVLLLIINSSCSTFNER